MKNHAEHIRKPMNISGNHKGYKGLCCNGPPVRSNNNIRTMSMFLFIILGLSLAAVASCLVSWMASKIMSTYAPSATP